MITIGAAFIAWLVGLAMGAHLGGLPAASARREADRARDYARARDRVAEQAHCQGFKAGRAYERHLAAGGEPIVGDAPAGSKRDEP